MQTWLLRGIGMAIVHAFAQAAVADVRAHHPEVIGMVWPLAIGVLAGIALLWAGLDGWLRRPVEPGTWFAAGLLAGPLAGLLGVVAQSLLVDRTGLEALWAALTGGAAFTALLVTVPALLGRALGQSLQPSLARAGGPDQRRAESSGPRR